MRNLVEPAIDETKNVHICIYIYIYIYIYMYTYTIFIYTHIMKGCFI